MSHKPLGPSLERPIEPRVLDEVWDRIEARRGSLRVRRGALVPLALAGAAVLVWLERGPAEPAQARVLVAHHAAVVDAPVEPPTVAVPPPVTAPVVEGAPALPPVARVSSAPVREPVAPETPPQPVPLDDVQKVARVAGTWRRALDEAGPAAAYTKLGQGGVARETTQAQGPDELLALADIARLSGHPEEALGPLQHLVTSYGADPRAAAASFTLGKLQLGGNPASAAASFDRAIMLGLPKALREDALARRVEAYAMAGDAERAHASRARYDAEYPAGRHRAAVAGWAP